MKIVRSIDNFLKRIEESLLISMVILMVVLAFLQVVLRNVFSLGIIWADLFLRHLVLWVGQSVFWITIWVYSFCCQDYPSWESF